jgi:hypothetical protein
MGGWDSLNILMYEWIGKQDNHEKGGDNVDEGRDE